jgi:hypothetical protein
MDYIFTIRFDDDAHSLSKDNGLPANLVGELLISLSKAIGYKKDDRFTLSEIRGNCYALDFTTNNESIYNTIGTVHKKISENDLSGFNSDQRKYAEKLKLIVHEKGYRINAYNPNKEFNYRIVDVPLDNKVESYYEIDGIYGIVASIGSSSLDTQPSIKLSREGYDIHITNDQERKLIKYFKKDKLLLTVQKKISFETNKVESASLIDFEVIKSDKGTFSNEANKLMQQYKKRGLFPKVNDTSLAVRNLRENINLRQLAGNEE